MAPPSRCDGTSVDAHTWLRKPGTVGVPLRGVEVRLTGESGEVIETAGTVGEIQVRGPNLFTGYLNRPDATAEVFAGDGWFRTGDMATRDAGP